MEQQIVRGDWCMGDITPESKALVAALATTVQHHKILSDLEEGGMNLYQTLTPQHLGKAMATGLVSWEMMTKWTTAQVDAGQVIPSCAPSETPGVRQEAQEQLVVRHTQVQAQRQRRTLMIQDEDYEHLRRLHPPRPPQELAKSYLTLLEVPKSPSDTQICKFEPAEPTEVFARRWQWWEALSKVMVYVKEYYLYTEWEHRANAMATGTPGQEVVRTAQGTITWIPNDGRIVITHLRGTLQTQMRAGFPPWDPERDLAKRHHRGKIPVQIANLMQAKGMKPLFQ